MNKSATAQAHAYVEMKNINKTFGTVHANKDVNFAIHKGEIHALLGENGSGKSTLVSMLSGEYSPDSGAIYIDGKEVVFSSPKDAINAGIGIVHQHFKLVDVLSAKENIVMGRKAGFIHSKELSGQIKEIADRYGLAVDPDKKVYQMSVGEQQTVEILKMLYRNADVLILDEPTAVLTPQEIKRLFEILNRMKAEGCAIVIITHKLREVMEISDKVTVLRKGESIATLETKSLDAHQLTEMMVGYAVNLKIERAEVPDENKKTVLEVKNLTLKGQHNNEIIKNISFYLRTGEILGVAGIAGSGQKELCESIAGLYKPSGGDILLNGKSILGLSPLEIVQQGINMSFVPEDRLGMGLVGSLNVIDNVMLRSYRNSKGIFIDRKAGKLKAEHIVDHYDVSTPSVYHQVKKLSGGNIQKVLLGREIDSNPQVLITAYPARGLDIGASYNIYNVLNEQKKEGVAILYIGEDLDVILELCDRIMVLSNGEIMNVVNARKVTKEQLGWMMLGEQSDYGQAKQNVVEREEDHA